MRVLKKMSFDALVGNISIEDMKFIMAGSGSVVDGSYYTQPIAGGFVSGGGSGNMGYYASDRGLSSQFSPAGTLLFTPNGNYSNPSISSNQNTYGYGTANYGGTYGNGTTNNNGEPVSNGTGWVTTSNGMITTDALSIKRLFGLIDCNLANGADPSKGINTFLINETTVAGRAQNDALYGGWLNEVVVINSYKGPSTIPIGIVIDSGNLKLNTGILMGSGLAMGSGSTTTTPM